MRCPGHKSLMAYTGGALRRALCSELPDEQIRRAFTADLEQRSCPSCGAVAAAVVKKWPHGNCYPTLSSRLDRVLDVESAVRARGSGSRVTTSAPWAARPRPQRARASRLYTSCRPGPQLGQAAAGQASRERGMAVLPHEARRAMAETRRGRIWLCHGQRPRLQPLDQRAPRRRARSRLCAVPS